MHAPDTESAPPWYRHLHVWLLIAFPAISVFGGIAMLVLAIRTDDGLVADDYYRQGMEINQSLGRDRAALAAGLGAKLDLDVGAGRIRVTLRAHPDFGPPARLRLTFMHPTRSGMDHVVDLSAVDALRYEGTLPDLERARWYALIEADDWRLIETIDRR